MKGALTKWIALLATGLLVHGVVPGKAVGQEDATFTPIPVIKGMQLLPEGTAAPTFLVKDIDGNEYDFADHQKEKAHMIVFWSIFCEPCREEMPVINQIYHEFKEKQVDVLAVNLDGEPFLEGIRGYIKQFNFSFRVLLDELDGDNFRIADPYQVAGTPVLYLVNSKGEVFTGKLGRVTSKDLRALITNMLEKG